MKILHFADLHLGVESYGRLDPATGLIGPAADAARLVAAYLNRSELDGVRILSSQTVQMMTQEGHVMRKEPEARAYKDLVHGLG